MVRKYSRAERCAILKYICDHKRYSEIKGRKLYQDIEESGIVQRSWGSMWEHVRKQILPTLELSHWPLTAEDRVELMIYAGCYSEETINIWKKKAGARWWFPDSSDGEEEIPALSRASTPNSDVILLASSETASSPPFQPSTAVRDEPLNENIQITPTGNSSRQSDTSLPTTKNSPSEKTVPSTSTGSCQTAKENSQPTAQRENGEEANLSTSQPKKIARETHASKSCPLNENSGVSKKRKKIVHLCRTHRAAETSFVKKWIASLSEADIQKLRCENTTKKSRKTSSLPVKNSTAVTDSKSDQKSSENLETSSRFDGTTTEKFRRPVNQISIENVHMSTRVENTQKSSENLHRSSQFDGATTEIFHRPVNQIRADKNNDDSGQISIENLHRTTRVENIERSTNLSVLDNSNKNDRRINPFSQMSTGKIQGSTSKSVSSSATFQPSSSVKQTLRNFVTKKLSAKLPPSTSVENLCNDSEIDLEGFAMLGGNKHDSKYRRKGVDIFETKEKSICLRNKITDEIFGTQELHPYVWGMNRINNEDFMHLYMLTKMKNEITKTCQDYLRQIRDAKIKNNYKITKKKNIDLKSFREKALAVITGDAERMADAITTQFRDTYKKRVVDNVINKNDTGKLINPYALTSLKLVDVSLGKSSNIPTATITSRKGSANNSWSIKTVQNNKDSTSTENCPTLVPSTSTNLSILPSSGTENDTNIAKKQTYEHKYAPSPENCQILVPLSQSGSENKASIAEKQPYELTFVQNNSASPENCPKLVPLKPTNLPILSQPTFSQLGSENGTNIAKKQTYKVIHVQDNLATPENCPKLVPLKSTNNAVLSQPKLSQSGSENNTNIAKKQSYKLIHVQDNLATPENCPKLVPLKSTNCDNIGCDNTSLSQTGSEDNTNIAKKQTYKLIHVQDNLASSENCPKLIPLRYNLPVLSQPILSQSGSENNTNIVKKQTYKLVYVQNNLTSPENCPKLVQFSATNLPILQPILSQSGHKNETNIAKKQTYELVYVQDNSANPENCPKLVPLRYTNLPILQPILSQSESENENNISKKQTYEHKYVQGNSGSPENSSPNLVSSNISTTESSPDVFDNIVISSSEDSDDSLCSNETVLRIDLCSDNVSTLSNNSSFEFPDRMATSSTKESDDIETTFRKDAVDDGHKLLLDTSSSKTDDKLYAEAYVSLESINIIRQRNISEKSKNTISEPLKNRSKRLPKNELVLSKQVDTSAVSQPEQLLQSKDKLSTPKNKRKRWGKINKSSLENSSAKSLKLDPKISSTIQKKKSIRKILSTRVSENNSRERSQRETVVCQLINKNKPLRSRKINVLPENKSEKIYEASNSKNLPSGSVDKKDDKMTILSSLNLIKSSAKTEVASSVHASTSALSKRGHFLQNKDKKLPIPKSTVSKTCEKRCPKANKSNSKKSSPTKSAKVDSAVSAPPMRKRRKNKKVENVSEIISPRAVRQLIQKNKCLCSSQIDSLPKKNADSSIVTIESSVKSKSELPIKSKYSLRSKDKRIPTLKSTKQQIRKRKDVLKNRKMV